MFVQLCTMHILQGDIFALSILWNVPLEIMQISLLLFAEKLVRLGEGKREVMHQGIQQYEWITS